MSIKVPEAFSHLEINDEIQMALDTVYDDKKSLIVSGNAGVGKSQFTKIMKAIDAERKIVSLYVAPTGIAAVNIGGATIHSTFGLGIALKNPQTASLKEEVRELLHRVNKVVIDEISMVRADLFDIMHYLSVKAKNKKALFGGIQVVCIGDLYQIPPIVGQTRVEKEFFSNLYGGNPYFFGSDAYRLYHSDFVRIEFSKIYRQKDSRYKGILNRIRLGHQTDEDLEVINDRVMHHKAFKKKCKEGIYIAPYNNIVSEININSLEDIPEKEITCIAQITGMSQPRSFLAPEYLKIKKGAKIMMLINDTQRAYQNGTLGYFDKMLSSDVMQVLVKGNPIPIRRYEFIEYQYVILNGELVQTEKGSFIQFPVTLGFAFTGHKSQGCTFESGYVDFAYKVFAEHLCYVMLSRFTDFNKVGLQRDLEHKDIMINPFVQDFMATFGGKE